MRDNSDSHDFEHVIDRMAWSLFLVLWPAERERLKHGGLRLPYDHRALYEECANIAADVFTYHSEGGWED